MRDPLALHRRLPKQFHRTGIPLEAARICTTTDRRFRQVLPNILWFAYEFFLTTSIQPLILRTQTRGNVNELFRESAPAAHAESRPGFTENRTDPAHFAPRLQFKRGLAGLFLFSVRDARSDRACPRQPVPP